VLLNPERKNVGEEELRGASLPLKGNAVNDFVFENRSNFGIFESRFGTTQNSPPFSTVGFGSTITPEVL
jgi:hypothetical protein